METEALFKRCGELYARCEDTATVTCTGFLTPAEQYALEREAVRAGWERLYLFGGNPECERKIAFFLPFYMDAPDLDLDACISAFSAVTRFSAPGHRDYLGSLLGLGIRRECIGDIYVQGECGWFYCVPTVAGHVEASLERIGHSGVRLKRVSLEAVPAPRRRTETVQFTVQSVRLDAVAAGMFGTSRSAMAQLIAAGALSLNYSVCMKVDVPVAAGDVISVRGYGKGTFLGETGVSRKGRTFVSADILK